MGQYQLQRNIQIATPSKSNKWTSENWVNIGSSSNNTENLSVSNDNLQSTIVGILTNTYKYNMVNCKIEYRIWDNTNNTIIANITPVYCILNGNTASTPALKTTDNSDMWNTQLSGGNESSFNLQIAIAPNVDNLGGGTATYDTTTYMNNAQYTGVGYDALASRAATIYNKIYLSIGDINVNTGGANTIRTFALSSTVNGINLSVTPLAVRQFTALTGGVLYLRTSTTEGEPDTIIDFDNKVKWNMQLSALTANSWHQSIDNEIYTIPYKIFFANSIDDIPSGLTPESTTFFTLIDSNNIEVTYTNPNLSITGLNTQIYKDTNITINIDTDGDNGNTTQ